jgi:hypothetical protein
MSGRLSGTQRASEASWIEPYRGTDGPETRPRLLNCGAAVAGNVSCKPWSFGGDQCLSYDSDAVRSKRAVETCPLSRQLSPKAAMVAHFQDRAMRRFRLTSSATTGRS